MAALYDLFEGNAGNFTVTNTDSEMVSAWYSTLDLPGAERTTASAKLTEAVEICRKYPDKLPYIDKCAELLNCLLDVYYAMDDMRKCRELIAEIDRINDEYKEQGVFRKVNDAIRQAVELQ